MIRTCMTSTQMIVYAFREWPTPYIVDDMHIFIKIGYLNDTEGAHLPPDLVIECIACLFSTNRMHCVTTSLHCAMTKLLAILS